MSAATATRDGRSLNARDIDIFHVVDGRVTEMWSTTMEPIETDEFWG